MRIAILTSNAIRHKYVANTLAAQAEQALVVCECRSSDSAAAEVQKGSASPLDRHFYQRYRTEAEFFAGNDTFCAETLPLLSGELNLDFTYGVVKDFGPDAVFVFGSSIIREPLLLLPPQGRFINLHLGLSPYYRGSGTNFWPFVNGELEYVGSSMLHIDAGVDTGDIIAHVRPEIQVGDDVHTVGCKVIEASTSCLVDIIRALESGEDLKRIKQWDVPNARYYRRADFDEEVLARYQSNLESGLVEEYVKSPSRALELVSM